MKYILKHCLFFCALYCLYVVDLQLLITYMSSAYTSDYIYVVDLQLLIAYVSSIYSFWLHICRRLTASDYIFGIFNLFVEQ
jgi:hypothetical protein